MGSGRRAVLLGPAPVELQGIEPGHADDARHDAQAEIHERHGREMEHALREGKQQNERKEPHGPAQYPLEGGVGGAQAAQDGHRPGAVGQDDRQEGHHQRREGEGPGDVLGVRLPREDVHCRRRRPGR